MTSSNPALVNYSFDRDNNGNVLFVFKVIGGVGVNFMPPATASENRHTIQLTYDDEESLNQGIETEISSTYSFDDGGELIIEFEAIDRSNSNIARPKGKRPKVHIND